MKNPPTTMKRPTNAKEYLLQPYSRVVIPDSETKTFAAYIAEFPGCVAQGKSLTDALTQLEEVAEEWVDASLRAGHKIPEPNGLNECSGKFALRLPRSLHREATQISESEGVSLNQFFVSAIAQCVGAKTMYSTLAIRIEKRLQAAVTDIGNLVVRPNWPIAIFAGGAAGVPMPVVKLATTQIMPTRGINPNFGAMN